MSAHKPLSAVNSTSVIWAGGLIAFASVEILVCYLQWVKSRGAILSFHFLYLPVMLSLPISTIFPLYVKLKSSVEFQHCPETVGRLSYLAAVSIIIAYVTLLICMGQVL